MSNSHSPQIDKWLKLIRAEGVGPTTFFRLLQKFHTIDKIFEVSMHQLMAVDGIGPKTAQSIFATCDSFDAEAEIESADKLGVTIIHYDDDRYPALLKAIYDPPPVLYVKGKLARSDSLAVAIVGSRRCSLYGQEQASRFAHLLASAGFTIVSGMARGIDTSAHRGALAAGGRTIAVQGCGLANIFPKENEKLFESISSSGACISELPLGYEPLAENFPGRNRIIAGLSLATIVIEASSKSGALITARASLDSNRDVMVVPGRIDSLSNAGSHLLIKQGARLIDCIDDVMDTLGNIGKGLHTHAAQAAGKAEEKVNLPLFDRSRIAMTEIEKNVYKNLDFEPIHIEEILAKSDLPTGKVNSALISLRLKSAIKQLPGNIYVKL